ncbi:CTB family bacteriocin [Acaryochloris sp. IP29b_bin.148]|uniref:CTB family bacteriocin n=1 Tax=Acaryochloris sp. IP29b_bin.148 TaxID=2969218 RepID=UPI002634D243|nr:CTB family bacteriocin [Acaryochloris sp. IP29b_bin.148]
MSELFTELSDQQQELVAGGAVALLNINATSFYSNTELLGSTGVAASGPGGSVAAGEIAGANQEIFTNAFSLQAGEVD